MALEHNEIIFTRDEAPSLVEQMEEIVAQHDGIVVSAARSWVNVRPYFGRQHDADLKWEPPLRRLFSAKGPFVPLATWVPAFTKKRAEEPAKVGLTHPKGPSAVSRLSEQGVGLPDGWVVEQDHSRRGIVLQVAPDTSCAETLDYLLDASELLCELRLTGKWVADIIAV